MQARRLVEDTYESMKIGIEVVKPGVTTGDIGFAIQRFAEGRGESVGNGKEGLFSRIKSASSLSVLETRN